LAKAQASGDLAAIRSALEEAKAAGADPAQIETALAEVAKASSNGSGGMLSAAPPPNETGEQAGPGNDAAVTAREAEELRARAETFKKQGNEKLKANTKSSAREALALFTSGLEVRCSDRVLNAQLHGNRAHVHMLLRQFVEAIDDCKKAIELDKNNLKVYWRAAKSSFHLDLCRNGMQYCEDGLKVEPKDAELLRLRDACAEKLANQQLRRAELDARRPQQASGDYNADEAMAVQEKVNDLSEQLENLRGSIRMKQMEFQKASLTKRTIDETPGQAKLYQSVGRCFLLQNRTTVEEQLSSAISTLEGELPKLSKAHDELEKRKEGAEKEFREMIEAIRRQGGPNAAGAA